MSDTRVESIRIVKQFFRQLYGDCVGLSGDIVMWSKAPHVGTTWKDDIEIAAQVAVERAFRVDSYFQPCLHDKDLVMIEVDRRIAAGKTRADGSQIKRTLDDKRGYNQSASLMPGLWADIDTQEGNHDTNKEGLPPSTSKVVSVLQGLEAPPSVIIDTGGGVHAYWLFSEPLELVTDEDRTNATELNYRWQQGYLRGKLEEMGWSTLDSVYDLARVMRVPGTMNRKYDPPRDVKIVTDNGKRYEVDAFEMYIPERIGGPPMRPVEVTRIAGIPTEYTTGDIIETMCSLDLSFKLIWDGRKDYESQSHRDLAIASIMAKRAGIKPDKILNAIVHNRRMLKAKRTPEEKQVHYYETTIALAMDGARIEQQEDEGIEDLQRELATNRADIKKGNQKANDARAGILARVSSMLGLKNGMSIIAIECVTPGGGQARTFTLKTTNGSRILGDISGLRSQQKFMDALADVFLVAPDPLSTKVWRQMYGLLMQLVDTVDLGEDATEEGQTRSLIRAWIGSTISPNGIPNPIRHQCAQKGLPWIHQGKVHICPAFAHEKLSRLAPGLRMTLRDLTKRLKDIGATKTIVRAKLPADEDGFQKQYDMWVFPHNKDYWMPQMGDEE